MAQPTDPRVLIEPMETDSSTRTTDPYVMLLRNGMALLITYYDDIDDGRPLSSLVDKKQLESYDTRVLDRLFDATVKDPEVRYVAIKLQPSITC